MIQELTLLEQIAIVMQDFHNEVQYYILAFCLWGLVIIGCIGLMATTGALQELVKKWTGLTLRAKWFAVLSVAFMTLTGATKGWNISFENGIKQNPIQPSNVTNNTVTINWTRDTSQGVYVPDSAAVYIDYRPIGSTNEWGLLAQSVLNAWTWTGEVNNATGYNYNVWAYYIPPEPVHTNGVWVYKTLKDRRGENPIPLRARIEVNGKAISTPKEKRKDEEND